MSDKRPIGFMDSGVGGISVLREAVQLLPQENFIYYGDSANAPYGTKTDAAVLKLTINAVEYLREQGCKAIVIACNTATSAAIEELRARYDFPIIGIEPAVKPAVAISREDKILVMATPMTLKRPKFADLVSKHADTCQILPLPCPGLVELIESGHLGDPVLMDYLQELLAPYLPQNIAVVVLGCTHYPFVRPALQKVLGERTEIIDGSFGTAKQLWHKLREFNLLNTGDSPGYVKIYNSAADADLLSLSASLLHNK